MPYHMSPRWHDDRNIPWGDAPSPIYPVLADFMAEVLPELAWKQHPFLMKLRGRLIVKREFLVLTVDEACTPYDEPAPLTREEILMWNKLTGRTK